MKAALVHLTLGSMIVGVTACGGVETEDYDAELESSSAELTQSQRRDIATARAATAKYHRLDVAIADGYVDTGLPCFDGQGYHYIRPDLLNTYDITAPTVLVYSPDGKLVAIEWVTPVDSVGGVRPVLFEETYHGPVLDPPLFVLHVWAWRNNPDGMFADANPHITCP